MPGAVSKTLAVAAARATEGGWLTRLLMLFLVHFTYVALVILLVIAGTGMPIPEDIPLITAGYLCHPVESPIAKANLEDVDENGIPDHPMKRVPNLYLMMGAGMLGVLLGDSIVFSIGRRGLDSNNVVARHIRKVLHSKRREKVERHFAQHGNLTVFAGRFLPGFRSIIFAFAGMSKMSYARFIAIDGLAAAISVPTFIFLGYYFADRLNVLFDFITRIKHIVIPVALVIAIGAIAIFIIRRRRQTPATVTPNP